MGRVVLSHGLAGLTVANVADEAGMQRTLVFHYFGDRQSLIADFIEHTVAAYGDKQIFSGRDGGLSECVAALFAPGYYRDAKDLAIWQELIALATRDDSVRKQLSNLWRKRWLPEIERNLAEEFPHAQAEDVAAVAYGLAALVEAHWAFRAQGLTQRSNTDKARSIAQRMVNTLAGG